MSAEAVEGHVRQLCLEHDLTFEKLISVGGAASAFVARVTTAQGIAAALKQSRLKSSGEASALKAWEPTGKAARLLAELRPQLILIEWVEGEGLALVLKRGPEAVPAVGEMLRTLHSVPLHEGLEPLGLAPDSPVDAGMSKAQATINAATNELARLGDEQSVLLHGDLVLSNVIVGEAGPRVIDPRGVRGPAALDVAQLAVATLGRLGQPILSDLVSGYGEIPSGLNQAAVFITSIYWESATGREDREMLAHLQPVVDRLPDGADAVAAYLGLK